MAFPSVKDYGARGDGTTDDTAAFQNAFKDSRAVTVPSGVYNVTRIDVPVGHRLIGGGKEQTILLRRPGSGSLVRVWGIVEHLTVDGNWPKVESWMDVEVFPHGEINHIRVMHSSDGCASLNTGARVLNCEMIGPYSDSARSAWGIWFGGPNLSDILIENTTIRGTRMNAIFGEADGLRIINCQLYDNHSQTQPYGGGQIDVVVGSRNVFIKDNYLGKSGAGGAGLEIDAADGIIIANNIIERQSGAAIVLQSSQVRDAIVVGNVARDCGGRALTCEERINNLIWESNRFHNCRGGVRINADAIQDHGNAVT